MHGLTLRCSLRRRFFFLTLVLRVFKHQMVEPLVRKTLAPGWVESLQHVERWDLWIVDFDILEDGRLSVPFRKDVIV